jgi:hypothetical protein
VEDLKKSRPPVWVSSALSQSHRIGRISEVSEVTAPSIWPLLSFLFERTIHNISSPLPTFDICCRQLKLLIGAHRARNDDAWRCGINLVLERREDIFKNASMDPLPKRHDHDEVVQPRSVLEIKVLNIWECPFS